MPLTLPRRQDTEIGDFIVPDEDFYDGELTGYDDPIQSAFVDKRSGDYPMRIRLTFAIRNDDEFEGAEVSGYFDIEMNANRKASIFHVVAALSGDEPDEDDEIELDDLVGKRCRVRVVHKVKASREDPSRMLTFANIAEVKAAKRKKKPAAPPTDDDDTEGDPFDE